MVKKRKFNPLALLGLLGLLSIVGIVKGDVLWLSWLGWLAWLRYINHPIDERFKRNFNKAARNGFYISLVGMSAVFVIKALDVADKIVNGTIATVFIVMLFGFMISFQYYEKLGD